VWAPRPHTGFGLEFLGKAWDNLGNGTGFIRDKVGPHTQWPAGRAGVVYGDMATYGKQMQAWHETWARNVLRVLKPGAYLLAFSGSRTVHRLGCALENGGFEIRDMVVWIHSQGFPKGINPSKAFDREAGVEPEVIGYKEAGIGTGDEFGFMQSEKTQDIANKIPITAPSTDDAKKWAGWGTHLSPAFEPIVMARKPLDGTVIENLRRWGTGAINIDASRFGGPLSGLVTQGTSPHPAGNEALGRNQTGFQKQMGASELLGRYPKNLVLSHAVECEWVGVEEVDGYGGGIRGNSDNPRTYGARDYRGAVVGGMEKQMLDRYTCAPGCPVKNLDSQLEDHAQRYFYVPKPSRNEREFGLGPPLKCLRCEYEKREGKTHTKHDHIYNEHATVKSIQIMRYLIKLVTPPGGTVLEPFMGSGTTLIAAREENIDAIGIEREEAYAQIARMRIAVLPQEASNFF